MHPIVPVTTPAPEDQNPFTRARLARFHSFAMDPSAFNLGTVLLTTCGLFCLATLFFGTKGGYYDSDDYDGNGTAH